MDQSSFDSNPAGDKQGSEAAADDASDSVYQTQPNGSAYDFFQSLKPQPSSHPQPTDPEYDFDQSLNASPSNPAQPADPATAPGQSQAP